VKWIIGYSRVANLVRMTLSGAMLVVVERMSERSGITIVVGTLFALSAIGFAGNLAAFVLPRERQPGHIDEPDFEEEFVTVFDPGHGAWPTEKTQPLSGSTHSTTR
jgi:hypothetical protein